ncbi:MAG: ankyrin repeat domain-containing protein [Epsilonproteobacteria bacterium]|nr:ankyrin repeat domain-containing protein [Campylobacterota bacterium]
MSKKVICFFGFIALSLPQQIYTIHHDWTFYHDHDDTNFRPYDPTYFTKKRLFLDLVARAHQKSWPQYNKILREYNDILHGRDIVKDGLWKESRELYTDESYYGNDYHRMEVHMPACFIKQTRSNFNLLTQELIRRLSSNEKRIKYLILAHRKKLIENKEFQAISQTLCLQDHWQEQGYIWFASNYPFYWKNNHPELPDNDENSRLFIRGILNAIYRYALKTFCSHDNCRRDVIKASPENIKDRLLHLYALDRKLFFEASNEDDVNTLLEQGADLSIFDAEGRTPLHSAVVRGNTHVAQALLSAGININVIDHYQRTALHYAVERNNIGMTQLLLDAGANTNMYGANFHTELEKERPLDTALLDNNYQMIELLLSYGAIFDQRSIEIASTDTLWQQGYYKRVAQRYWDDFPLGLVCIGGMFFTSTGVLVYDYFTQQS